MTLFPLTDLKRITLFILLLVVLIPIPVAAQKIDSTWTRIRQFTNQPMPPVEGITIGGKTIDSNYFNHHVTLLNFANLINVGSLQQVPFLNYLQHEFSTRPFQVLSVLPNSDVDVRNFNSPVPVEAEAYKLRETFKLPVMEYDAMPACRMPRPAGEPIAVLCDSVVKDFLIGGYPTSCLIDREGIIRYVHVGFAPKEKQGEWMTMVEKQIQQLLGPPSAGEQVVLRNIFFETNSIALRPESVTELNGLYEMLAENSGMVIAITGYTDNAGSEAYNLQLSENRARAVYDYLRKKGIAENRLSYHGMGEANPVADNEKESGRAQNRRIEFKVMKQ